MKIVVTVEIESGTHPPDVIQSKLSNLLQTNFMIKGGLKSTNVTVLDVKAKLADEI